MPAPLGATVSVVPAAGLVSPLVDRAAPIGPYCGAPSVVETTPSPLLSADAVGHMPIPPMWMCCTCGYGLPLNVAAKPLTCSLMVARLPFSCNETEPDAVEWFNGFSVAW